MIHGAARGHTRHPDSAGLSRQTRNNHWIITISASWCDTRIETRAILVLTIPGRIID